jgi:hypothetical protein
MPCQKDSNYWLDQIWATVFDKLLAKNIAATVEEVVGNVTPKLRF